MALQLRNPFATIVVTGVHGVGKTTVLGKLVEMLKNEGFDVLLVNFGDYMFKVASEKGLVKHRDEIRKLQLQTQLELQRWAAEAIVRDAGEKLKGEKSVLIVDTHSVIKTPSGYWPGLPRHVIEALRPDSIVVIEANPELIIARRQRDKGRYREDMGGVEELRELMSMARIAAMASAVLTASSVFIVENPEGRPEEAARRILELVKMLR